MPGIKEAVASTTGVKVRCFWQNDPSEVPAADEIAGWVDLIYFRFPHLGLFRLLDAVEVWEPTRPNAPNEFKALNPWESLYQPWSRTVKMHRHFAGIMPLAHEIGHHFQQVCGLTSNGSAFGKAMLRLYCALRFCSEGESTEQMPSDFANYLVRCDREPTPGLIAWFHAACEGRGV